MKTNFFFKAVLVIVLAMVTEVSMAQRVVNGMKWTKKQSAEYLVKNPSDTVVLALSEIKKNGDIRFVERQVGYFLEKKLVSRRDTLIYLEEMSSNISQEDKEAVLRRFADFFPVA